MKKTTLLLTLVCAGAATADAPSFNGLYAGASLGLANTSVKYAYNDPTHGANNQTPSNTGMQYGAFGGYNMTMARNIVIGGELFAGGDSSKVKTYSNASNTNPGPTQVKRSLYYGVAPRVGYMVMPNMLAYVRLGVEAGQWKANLNTVGSFLTGATASQSVSKNRVNLAPGVGFDMFATKSIFMRAQYHYLFGPTLKMNTAYTGGTATQSLKTSQNVLTLAVGYKF